MFVTLADAAFARGRVGEAHDLYRDAIDLDPSNGDLRAHLAVNALLPLGLVREARTAARHAARLSDSLLCWRTLGHVEHVCGDPEIAKRAYERALDFVDEDPSVMFDVAGLHL